MRNIALKLMYNGTAYHGWQIQKTETTVAETLERGLSMVCGEPVRLVGCGRTDAGVHAEHYIANFHTSSRIPVDRLPFAVNTHTPEDSAAHAFEGTHDFRAVRSVGTQTKTTVRTVYYCHVKRSGELLELKVCANGFLYNMVRAITGTVLYAAEGKLTPADIPRILSSGDRTLAGPTVPPGGLYLTRVWYEDEQLNE